MFVKTDNKKIMTDLHDMTFSHSFLIKDMSVYNVLILYNTQ